MGLLTGRHSKQVFVRPCWVLCIWDSLPRFPPHFCGRFVASLDRKRLGADFWGGAGTSIRGVFDEETRRKPLAFAADAGRYGI